MRHRRAKQPLEYATGSQHKAKSGEAGDTIKRGGSWTPSGFRWLKRPFGANVSLARRSTLASHRSIARLLFGSGDVGLYLVLPVACFAA